MLMQENPETWTTSFSSGKKRLLICLTFSFSTRGERERETHNFYYADCSNIVLQSTPQLDWLAQSPISTNCPNKRAAHPIALSWTALTQVQSNSFFSTLVPGYIILWCLPASCGRCICTEFNPSTCHGDIFNRMHRLLDWRLGRMSICYTNILFPFIRYYI